MTAQSLDLLRHGDTGQRGFRGQLDDALSAAGWTQMRAATATGHWDAVVASPLQRCAGFARELAQQRGLPLHLHDGLREYHFGQWQAWPLERIAAEQGEALAAFWADPVAHPPPGAETVAAFHARILAAMESIGALPQRRVLVVTHGGVIRLLRCLEQGDDLRAMSAIEVPHAALHRLDAAVRALALDAIAGTC